MLKIKYKVNRIKPGSTIGVVSPSWSGPNEFPVVYEKGLDNLKKEFNFKLKEFKHTRSKYNDSIEYVKNRVEDIHAAFLDKEVEAIFITIGGSDSIRLLPYLDKDLITQNPKIVMGFSDATSILIYLAKLGLPAFYGPSVMAGFSEPEGLNKESVSHFKSFFFDKWESYEYPVYSKWTDDRYGWTDPNFLNREKEYKINDGVKILNQSSAREGVLIGGCLEIIEMLKGTKYGISEDDWNDASFFFETSEDKPTPEYVECALISYGVSGAWDKVKNLVISKSRGYTHEEYATLEKKILSVLIDKFNSTKINILSNVDIGHTQPMLIFPMGCNLKTEGSKLILTESPFN